MRSFKYLGLLALSCSAMAASDDWRGCYVGVHGGSAEVDSSYRGVFFVGDVINDNLGTVSGDGEFFGAQVGCRMLVSDNWVLGLRLSGSDGDTNARHPYINGTSPTNYVSYDADNLVTLSGQFGFLLSEASLLYVNLGYGQIDMLVEDTDPNYQEPIYFQHKDTLDDVMVGVGFEYRFNANWSVFAEYNQIDFGTERNVLLTDLSTWDIDDYQADIGHEMDFFKLGVNFQF
ncbi:hypothetical protein GCM10011365_16800 [Marinicella pacifica]|uniref:Outer membrane protein beta-barrel domain-containing protein n=1 Tax=Marinicella pacifica TaxID=1171543 RepID=A0A917CRI5_9GAMM|nr:outer membrane beta-barrel protein [Marinicella pacifica]GGF96147.1 hypothetical protein GCM10011365_16800 [Marinicella pacifica]